VFYPLLSLCLFYLKGVFDNVVLLLHSCAKCCPVATLLYKMLSCCYTPVQNFVLLLHSCTKCCPVATLLYKMLSCCYTPVQNVVLLLHSCTKCCPVATLLYKMLAVKLQERVLISCHTFCGHSFSFLFSEELWRMAGHFSFRRVIDEWRRSFCGMTTDEGQTNSENSVSHSFLTANPTQTILEANLAFREKKSARHVERRNGHLSIVTTQQAGKLGIRGSIPIGGRDAFSRHWVQTGSGARPALWSICNVSGKTLQRVKLSIGLSCAKITKDCCCNSSPLLIPWLVFN